MILLPTTLCLGSSCHRPYGAVTGLAATPLSGLHASGVARCTCNAGVFCQAARDKVKGRCLSFTLWAPGRALPGLPQAGPPAPRQPPSSHPALTLTVGD
jgi:hypothetical protein